MHRSSVSSTHTSASVSERKFAEKLSILNERGQGILTRVYNIRKVMVGWEVGGVRVVGGVVWGHAL